MQYGSVCGVPDAGVAIDLLSVAAERSPLWSRDLLPVNRQELKVDQQHEDI
jgi:hypothetical protein